MILKTNTKKLVEFCKKHGHIAPTFEDVKGIHGLFTYGHSAAGIMDRMISNWKSVFISRHRNHHMIEAPCIVTRNILEKSGHLNAFGSGSDSGLFGLFADRLYLRPETAQLIYHHYRRYKYLYGPTYGMGQVGRSFRFERSSQRTSMRCWEFTQMEFQKFTRSKELLKIPKLLNCLEIVTDTGQSYKSLVHQEIAKGLLLNDQYMRTCDLKYRLCIITKNPPHYSRFTADVQVMVDGTWRQMASINDRGYHDNSVMGCKPGEISVIEFSYGLNRLFWAITLKNFNGTTINYPKKCRILEGLIAIHKSADKPEHISKYMKYVLPEKIIKLSKIKSEKAILAYDKYYIAYTNRLEYLNENFEIIHTVKYG